MLFVHFIWGGGGGGQNKYCKICVGVNFKFANTLGGGGSFSYTVTSQKNFPAPHPTPSGK